MASRLDKWLIANKEDNLKNIEWDTKEKCKNNNESIADKNARAVEEAIKQRALRSGV